MLQSVRELQEMQQLNNFNIFNCHLLHHTFDHHCYCHRNISNQHLDNFTIITIQSEQWRTLKPRFSSTMTLPPPLMSWQGVVIRIIMIIRISFSSSMCWSWSSVWSSLSFYHHLPTSSFLWLWPKIRGTVLGDIFIFVTKTSSSIIISIKNSKGTVPRGKAKEWTKPLALCKNYNELSGHHHCD